MGPRQEDSPDDFQDAQEASWHDDEFEIGSGHRPEAEEKKNLFSFVRSLFGKKKTRQPASENEFLTNSEHDFEINDERNLTFFRRSSSQSFESEFSAPSRKTANDPSLDTDDEFDIAIKPGTFQPGVADEQTPLSPSQSSLEAVHDDFDVIGQKDLPRNVAREHITAEFVEIVREDLDIAGKSNDARYTSEFIEPFSQPNEPEPGAEFEEISPNDRQRQKLKTILQDQFEDFINRIESPAGDHFVENETQSATAHLTPEDTLTAASVPEQKINFFALLLAVSRHAIRWLLLLPIRAINQTGNIYQQSRSRIEPLVLGLPALILFASIYLSQIWLQTKDLLRESSRLSAIATRKLQEKDLQSARIAASQLCAQAKTPANLWLLSEVMLASPNDADKLAAVLLIEALASPEYNNYANAHLFLAKKIWNSDAMKVEEVPRFLNQVKYHLRTGLSAEPNRTDLLEMLVDLLMATSEFDEVVRLATPRLESWPTGYYYLARIAFKRGDKINQEIFARFIVNRYESLASVIAESPQDRERYLLCLALAGQWAKAEPLLDQWVRGLEGEKAVNFWKNRFLAIKALGMLDTKPDEYDPIVKELTIAIKANPKNEELWNALTRFADRDKPLAETYYKDGIQLARQNINALDSTELMIWGNLARKKNDPATSRELLEASVKLDPNNQIAANNLANLLYKIDPKEPERALKLIQGVLQAEPDNLIYIETRGQILAILGRDNEAINDLLRSLSAFPDIGEIHETLIALYRKKGRDDLARFHETRLKEIALKAQALKAEERQKPASEE